VAGAEGVLVDILELPHAYIAGLRFKIREMKILAQIRLQDVEEVEGDWQGLD